MDIPTALKLGLAHYQGGRLDEAEDVFRRILAVVPAEANALQLLGLVENRRGNYPAAIDLMRRSVAIIPRAAQVHLNLGVALRMAGRIDEAIAAYRAALALDDNMAQAHMNLTGLLVDRRDYEAATAHLRKLIQLNPDDTDARNLLGKVLRERGQLPEAIDQLRRAIALAPTSAEAHDNLAKALSLRGEFQEATSLAKRATELAPKEFAARVTLGNILLAHSQTAQAMAEYLTVLEDRPSEGAVWLNYAAALRLLGRVDESVAAYRRGVKLNPKSAAGGDALLLTLHYLDDIEPAAIFAEHVEWARRHAEPMTPQASRPKSAGADSGRRIRVGYVSPDFRDHVVARFIEPALAFFDRTKFEVYCYSDSLRSDAVTQRLQTHATAWRHVAGMPDEQLAEQIRADQIDILIDLAGHTADNRLLMFARRPAQVQATFLGYPDTTGMSAVDWRITDAHADPPGLTESLHSERLIRLDCAWCYQPPADAPQPKRREPADDRSDGGIKFGCFNALPKISGKTLDLWAEVLKAVEGSQLLLKASAFSDVESCERYFAALESRGVGRDRVELAPVTPRFMDHLAMYDRMDVALDTFPYAGTTTTCEALWMGVPVVTLAGRTHASRVGVSLLSHAGLAEWVASTPGEFGCGSLWNLPGIEPRLDTFQGDGAGKTASRPC